MDLYSYKDNPLYMDRYERSKRWVKILPMVGRPLQTSELIEIQSLLADHQKQLLNTIYKSGTIISGLDIIVISSTSDSINLSITEGQIYIEGFVIDIDASSQVIPTTGTHIIGVLLDELIIDERDDITLRQGATSYGLEGSSRLIWEAFITLNDPRAIPIASVIEGQLVLPPSTRQSKIEDQLVSYLADKDGSFIVRGLTIEHIETIIPPTIKPIVDTNLQELELKTQTINTLQASLVEIETRISSLRQKLTRDTQDLNTTPSPSNLSKIQSTIREIELLTNSKDSIEEQLNKEKLTLAELTLFSKTSQSKQVTEVMAIHPGLAYIKGVRIPLLNTINLLIPKVLEQRVVEGVKFIYKSSTLDFISSLILQGLIQDTVDSTLTLVFKGLLPSDIIITKRISTLDTSESDILLKLIAFINGAIDENITVEGTTDKEELLTLINNYLALGIGINNSLLIQPKQILSGEIEIRVNSSSNLLYWDTRIGIVKNERVSNKYQLENGDIGEISNFIADLKQTRWQVSRGSNSDVDYIGEDSIYKILNVVASAVVYREGIDYKQQGQSSLIWLSGLNSKRPIAGSTYYVDYIYTDRLIEKKDYEINKETGVLYFTGRTPASGYSFSLTYSYFLPKLIYIYLNRNSTLSYNPNLIEGQDTLLLARVKMTGNKVEIIPEDNRALSPRELYRLNRDIKENLKLLSQIEIDLDTYQSLIEEGIDNPIGSFSDSLEDLSRINEVESSFSIAPGSRSITPKMKNKTLKVKYISGGIAHYPNQPEDYSPPNYVTIPFSSIEIIKQNRATRYRYISVIPNEFYRGRMYLDSNFHSYTDSSIYPGELLLNPSLTHNIRFIYSPLYETLVYSLVDNYYSLDSSLTSLVSPTPLPLLTVFIFVNGFKPNEDNLNLYFNNRKIDVSLIEVLKGTIKGVLGLRANSKGEVQVRVIIENVRYGTHLIELKGLNSYASERLIVADIPLINYLSNISEDIPLAFSQVPRDIVIPQVEVKSPLFAPINQRLQVDQETILTEILIRFKQIGEGDIHLSIREEDERGLPSSSILVEGKALTYWFDEYGTQSTSFILDYPLYITPYKNYFISISTSSEDFQLFTAQVGERDILDSTRIGSQLLNSGGLLLSKDGVSLSNYQDEDLSYIVKGGLFQTNQMVVIELGKYGILNNFTNISHFSYFSRDVIPNDTDIKYQYRTSENTQWIGFNVGEIVKISNGLVSYIEIRALLINGSNSYLSPFLDMSSNFIVLTSPSNNTRVTYKTINYLIPFNHIKVSIEVFQPPGSLTRCFLYTNDTTLELVKESSLPIDNQPSMELLTFISKENLNQSEMKVMITQYTEASHLIPFYRNFKSYVW